MRYFCTVFDKNYLFQGVALFNSLMKHAGAFRLYALCMDGSAFDVLDRMPFEELVPISLNDVLTPEAENIKELTNHGQFCWVCQPLICEYVINQFDVDMVTYLEADSLFFSSPDVLFDELGDNSVSLSPHNYHPKFDKTSTSGRFCTQFNAFRNNAQGLSVLEYWKKCCYTYRKEKPYEYPGQKSLDDWPQLFDGVKILENQGAGVAPWNVQSFSFSIDNGNPYVNGMPVVFYHYHSYARCPNGCHELGHYPLASCVVNSIYGKYVKELREAEKIVHAEVADFNCRRYCSSDVKLVDLLSDHSFVTCGRYLVQLKRRLKGIHNVFPDTYFA